MAGDSKPFAAPPLPSTAASPYQTPVAVSTRTVTSATALSMAMAPSGGQAVVLRPN